MKLLSGYKLRLSFMILLLYGISISFASGMSYFDSGNNTIYKLILLQTDSENILGFVISYIFLLLIIDIEGKSFIECLRRVALATSIFIVVFFTVNLTVYIVKYYSKLDFVNDWSHSNELYLMGTSPLTAMLYSLMFVYLRLFALSLLVAICNNASKSKVLGTFLLMGISVIEWNIYDTLCIYRPIVFLPMTHTKVTYAVSGMRPDGVFRMPYLYSILYWLVLILVICLILYFSINKLRRVNHHG